VSELGISCFYPVLVGPSYHFQAHAKWVESVSTSQSPHSLKGDKGGAIQKYENL